VSRDHRTTAHKMFLNETSNLRIDVTAEEQKQANFLLNGTWHMTATDGHDVSDQILSHPARDLIYLWQILNCCPVNTLV